SSAQLTSGDFTASVRAALRRSGLDPCALVLEITETSVMRNWTQARIQLEKLRELRIGVAIDDFGTGYSSLNALHLLPADYIKIDGAFTQRLAGEKNSLVVVEGVVKLAHELGYKVVAQGV